MKYWLLKSEPDVWSIDQQKKAASKGAPWDGVRNYQAAKNLKSMKKGDLCFFYHSNIGKEIVGIVADIIREISTFTITIRKEMLVSLNQVGTTIGRDINRKSITGECLSIFATMGNHGCSCWHHALASISITIR